MNAHNLYALTDKLENLSVRNSNKLKEYTTEILKGLCHSSVQPNGFGFFADAPVITPAIDMEGKIEEVSILLLDLIEHFEGKIK
jgi:hypothetical protein